MNSSFKDKGYKNSSFKDKGYKNGSLDYIKNF